MHSFNHHICPNSLVTAGSLQLLCPFFATLSSHMVSSHSSVLAMERILTYFWYFLLRSISIFCFFMFLDTLSKICVVDQLAKQRWHFWSYIKFFLWKKTRSQLLQLTAFLKSGWDHTFLGMPETTREHTRKIIQEMTEYYTVPEALVRGFNFLKGGQLW